MNLAKLVSSRTVRAELGDVSEMTIWRWVQSGVLPQPIKINGRNYWQVSAVERVKLGNAQAAA